MGFDVGGEELHEPLPDFIDRQNLGGGIQFGSGLWHAVHGAGSAVLGDGGITVISQESESFGAVASHASKQGGHYGPLPVLFDGFEKDIDRRAIRAVRGL